MVLSLYNSVPMAYFSPLKPLHPHLRNPVSLQELAAMAVPNPGETARTFLPPCHTVRKKLEEQEYQAWELNFRKNTPKISGTYWKGIIECEGKKDAKRNFILFFFVWREWLPYLDVSLSIFRFYIFVERNILIDVDMLRDLDLPISVKVDFLKFSFELGLLEI